MKDVDRVCSEVIGDKYRVSGLTKGSIITLDIGPLPGTRQNGLEKTYKYRTEIQVGACVCDD